MADEKERSPKADSAPEGDVERFTRRIYATSEPEFVGVIPVRQELEVLPADDPPKELGWTCREYVGAEVYRYSHGKVWEDLVLTRRDDLKPGDKIATSALFGGYCILTVTEDEDGELYGDSEGTSGMLHFNGDDRHCWVCSGHINKKAMAKFAKSSG